MLSLEQDSQNVPNPDSTAGDDENQDSTGDETTETESQSVQNTQDESTGMTIPTKTQLKAMSVEELKTLADSLGIEYEYTNKDDLIVLILAKYTE